MTSGRTLRTGRSAESGVSVLVVLVLLTVMLLGGLALSRMTELSTLVTGNISYKAAAMQATEIGLNTAYAAVRALTDEETSAGNWYFSQSQAQTTDGLPTVTWDDAPEVVSGAYSVRYVVERICTGSLPVTDAFRQCLLKEVQTTGTRAQDPNDPNKVLENPYSAQFRITTRVTGPKNTTVFVQSLMTKGST